MKTSKPFRALATLALFYVSAFAYGALNVPFKAQVPPPDSGDWSQTKNCGPTSVLMVAAYHLQFIPTSQHIKDLDDWMVVKGIITSVNNYNGDDTSGDDLLRIAKEYYGFQEVTKYNANDVNFLIQALSNGNPVIVGVNINLDLNKAGHFMVLVGMTDTNVIVKDPGHADGADKSYPISTFLASWATQTYCSIIIDGSAGRSTITGQNTNGLVIAEILAAYHHYGAQQTFGNPVASLVPYSDGYVAEWPWLTGCLFQIFDGGALGDSAILYDQNAGVNEAFPMHGQLWDYYKAHDGPNLLIGNVHLGGPVDQERYATDESTGNQLVVQRMAHGYLVYDTVTGLSNARSSQNPGIVTISLTPSFTAYALSDTQAYVSSGPVSGGVTYRVLRGGVQVGTLNASYDFTDSNLSPNTSYSYELVVVDGSGNINP